MSAVLPSRISHASASAWVSRRDPEVSQGRSLLCLSQGIEDQQRCKTYRHRASSSVSKPRAASSHVLHVSCLSVCLTSACVWLSWNQAAAQPKSTEAARNCSTPPEVPWCISLHGIPTSAAQLHSVKQTNVCLSLAENPLTCVCFSLMSLHEEALVFPLSPLQENTSSCLCPSKTLSNTMDFPGNP